MQQRGARIVGMAGALVVVGFMLIVVFGDPPGAPTAAAIGAIYVIAAVAILLARREWAALVATAITIPTGLLTLVAFANYIPDGLILMTATLMQGGGALALHRGGQSGIR
jgi:hypothetical protein